MKTLKISDEQFLELQHIAAVLRLRGLGGAPLLENLTAQKRYSLVLSRTVTQTTEVTFAAQDDADAEAKIEAYKIGAEQLHWELYDVPGKPKTVMVSEIMTRSTPDPVLNMSRADILLDECVPVDYAKVNAFLEKERARHEHDDPPAPGHWPKLREAWEVVNPDEAMPEDERKGVVIGIVYCPDDDHLCVTLQRTDGTTFDFYALHVDFDYKNLGPAWPHTYYRKVSDAP